MLFKDLKPGDKFIISDPLNETLRDVVMTKEELLASVGETYWDRYLIDISPYTNVSKID